MCSPGLYQNTEFEGTSLSVIVSCPLLLQSQCHIIYLQNIIQLCLGHRFFYPHYCQNATLETHTSDGWESNLHVKFIHGFLISICSCAIVVTSLRFVFLTQLLSLLSVYSCHVPPSFYFIWLTKPCFLNVLCMDIRLLLTLSPLCDCSTLTFSSRGKTGSLHNCPDKVLQHLIP